MAYEFPERIQEQYFNYLSFPEISDLYHKALSQVMGGGGPGGPFVQIKIDGLKQLIEDLAFTGRYLDIIAEDTYKSLQGLMREYVENVFIAAAAKNAAGFPFVYVLPIVKKVRDLDFIFGASGGASFELVMDFDSLGTKKDLTVAYHRGAALAGGGQVDLPWTSGENDSALKRDVEERYEFWRAMFHGETYYSENGRPIDTSGLWEETIDERLLAWELTEKAPQWLLLQYGQSEWEPTIDPVPIVEKISGDLYFALSLFLEQAIERLITKVYGISRKTAFDLEAITTDDVGYKLQKTDVFLNQFKSMGNLSGIAQINLVRDALFARLGEGL